jgi:hypothetical protein
MACRSTPRLTRALGSQLGLRKLDRNRDRLVGLDENAATGARCVRDQICNRTASRVDATSQEGVASDQALDRPIGKAAYVLRDAGGAVRRLLNGFTLGHGCWDSRGALKAPWFRVIRAVRGWPFRQNA